MPYTGGLAAEQVDAIARAAIAERYPNADIEYLENWPDEELIEGTECMLNGRPVMILTYGIWGGAESDDDWIWSEGDGYYTVTVNLEDGRVEEILHNSGLAGNG